MRVIWSALARRDQVQQLGWYGDFNPAAAYRMSLQIVDQSRLLARFPRMGGLRADDGVRYLPVRGTPFVLLYRVEDEVTILRMFHKAQDWPGRF